MLGYGVKTVEPSKCIVHCDEQTVKRACTRLDLERKPLSWNAAEMTSVQVHYLIICKYAFGQVLKNEPVANSEAILREGAAPHSDTFSTHLWGL
jgi:hypothetical protein